MYGTHWLKVGSVEKTDTGSWNLDYWDYGKWTNGYLISGTQLSNATYSIVSLQKQ